MYNHWETIDRADAYTTVLLCKDLLSVNTGLKIVKHTLQGKGKHTFKAYMDFPLSSFI